MGEETLDAGVLALLELLASAPATQDIMQARENARRVRLALNLGGPAVPHRDLELRTSAGIMAACLYGSAAECSAERVIVYLHGGGWALLGLDTHDRLMREICAASGLAVVGLDYPLAPEAPFPAAIHAIAASLEQIHERGVEDLPRRKSFIPAGDSAGANLAVAVTLLLRDRASAAFAAVKALWLAYGVFDCDLSRPSYSLFGGPPFTLTRERMEWFWSCYCPEASQRCHPYASPMRAQLTGLPPTELLIASHDVLRDENLAFASKLEQAGVTCQVRLVSGTAHAFLEAVALSPAVHAALQASLAAFRRDKQRSARDREALDKLV